MKKKLPDIVSLIIFIYAVSVVIFMPFQPLLMEALGHHTGLSSSLIFWLAHWYEIFLLPLGLYYCIDLMLSKSKIRFLEWISYGLILLGAISIVFFSQSISRGLEGFRFTLIGVVFFLFSYRFLCKENYTLILRNIYLVLALLVSIIALTQRFDSSHFWNIILGKDSSIAFGNFGASTFIQSPSILQGPNQLGSYLLPATFIFLKIFRRQFRKVPKNYFKINVSLIGFLFAVLAIFVSFSRSAFLGLFVGMVIWFAVFIKNRSIRVIGIIFVLLFVVATVLLYLKAPQKITELITHGSSQASHQSALILSVKEMKTRIHEPIKLLFGAGLGTAGPAVLKYGDGFIPESWYIQLLLELGVVGLMLWLIFIVKIAIVLYNSQKPGLFLGLIAVSVCAMFLHTWADNPTLSITLLILIGAKLPNVKDSH